MQSKFLILVGIAIFGFSEIMFEDVLSEPPLTGEMRSSDAFENLKLAFRSNVTFDGYELQDVIVGYGISSDQLIVGIDKKFSNETELHIIQNHIIEIVGDDTGIRFTVSEPITDEDVCGSNAILVEGICTPACGDGTQYIDGICHVIKTEKYGYGPISNFIDALFFMQIIIPFFVPGATIFVVLSKTPRFSRMIRLSVCIPATVIILYFLSGLILGWYPPVYA